MGQSALKPVIDPYQIGEFATFKDMLEKEEDVEKYLIIVGYNLNEDDNHILSFLRKFLQEEDHKLIYCKYNRSQTFEQETLISEKKRILKLLRMDETSATTGKIDVRLHTGKFGGGFVGWVGAILQEG